MTSISLFLFPDTTSKIVESRCLIDENPYESTFVKIEKVWTDREREGGREIEAWKGKASIRERRDSSQP